MSLTAFLDTNLYAYVILPLLIFIARILDVSIGTIRVIFITRGYKFIAPILGFFEVLIWLAAIRQVMVNLTNVVCFFAYAIGFAAGTFAGMYIEEKISVGKVILRIISRRDAASLISALNKRGYVTTVTDAQGPKGRVKIIFTVIERHDLPQVTGIINKFDHHTFYSIEDVKYARENNFFHNGKRRLVWSKLKRKDK